MQQNLFQLTGVDLVVPVHGIEGAKAYPLGPSCRAPLFDDELDILYIKSTDANGFPTIKVYDFTERVVIDDNSPSAVSLNDIRALIREELVSVKEDIINAQQPISTDSGTTTDANTNANSYSSNTKHNSYGTAKQANSANTRNKQSGQNSSIVGYGEKQQ